MKLIKVYEEFWGRKSKSKNDDLEFDFLSAVGNLKRAINKSIEVHEKHYYNDTKIINSGEFQNELKSYIDKVISGSKTITEDFLDLVGKFENSLYNDNKFGIDSEGDYSLFGIFDDLISAFRACVRDKNERSISFLDSEAQHVIDNCDDSWVYMQSREDVYKVVDDFLNDDEFEKTLNDWAESEEDDIFTRWEHPEELQKDLEKYIGKKIEDFEYGDKLSAYKWVESTEIFQEILSEGTEEEKSQIRGFLDAIKEYFGL